MGYNLFRTPRTDKRLSLIMLLIVYKLMSYYAMVLSISCVGVSRVDCWLCLFCRNSISRIVCIVRSYSWPCKLSHQRALIGSWSWTTILLPVSSSYICCCSHMFSNVLEYYVDDDDNNYYYSLSWMFNNVLGYYVDDDDNYYYYSLSWVVVAY